MPVNAKLENVCGEIGTHITDFTRDMATAGQMSGNGLNYPESDALLMPRRLAEVSHRRFLGTKRKRSSTPGIGRRKDQRGKGRLAEVIQGTTQQETAPHTPSKQCKTVEKGLSDTLNVARTRRSLRMTHLALPGHEREAGAV